MIRGVTLRGGESPVPRGMQVEIKRPLVRDTITSRCVWGEEFLENLGGPGVLMLLREQCSPGCLDYIQKEGNCQPTVQLTSQQLSTVLPGREGVLWGITEPGSGERGRGEYCGAPEPS